MRKFFKLNFLISLILLGICIFGCGRNLTPNKPIAIALRAGTENQSGDEIPIVFNPTTGAYELRPIAGGVIPVPLSPVTYTGVTN